MADETVRPEGHSREAADLDVRRRAALEELVNLEAQLRLQRMRAASNVYINAATDRALAARENALGSPEVESIASYSENMEDLAAPHATHDEDALGPRGETMSNVSREEMDAKIQLSEARLETRLVQLDANVQRLIDAVKSSSDKSAADTVLLKTALDEVRADNRSTRWTIIITVVASVLAALAALWTTQQNLLSAVQTGISIQQAKEPPKDAAAPSAPK